MCEGGDSNLKNGCGQVKVVWLETILAGGGTKLTREGVVDGSWHRRTSKVAGRSMRG